MHFKMHTNLASMFLLLTLSLTCLWKTLQLIFMNSTIILEWDLSFINTSSIEFIILLDWMSCLFLSFVFIISSMVLLYSKEYMKSHPHSERFSWLVLGFVSSMSLMIISPNLISILLGWDGLGLVSYVLVIFYQNEKSANAGMITILSNRIGDVSILLSITLMFHLGSWSFFSTPELSNCSPLILLTLVLIAAMTKSAQMPFSAWLPAAMAAPTPVSALVHSSTLVTAGVYLLIRFNTSFMNTPLQKFMAMIASITMFMASLSANFEFDLKKIIALSTLSQLGLMIVTLALDLTTLAFFHLLTHALFKALLFLCAGSMIHNFKEYQDIRSMGSTTNSLPLTIACFNSANLSLCAFPFLAGFYSKDMILELSFLSNFNLVIFLLLVISTTFTVSYTTRMFLFTISSPFKLETASNISDKSNDMNTPMMVLSVFSLMSGSSLLWVIFPEPGLIVLPLMFKVLPILIVTLSSLFSFCIFSSKMIYPLPKTMIMTEFMGSMWFLPRLSTTLSKPILTLSILITQILDKGWSEFLGPQGIYNTSMNLSSKIQLSQENSVKTFMFSFVMCLTFVLVFFAYLYNSILE